MRQQTRHTGRRLGSIVVAVVATMLAAPAAASGVTFCVADSSCSGTAVLDVQTALNLAGANPGADRVQIGAGTFAGAGGFTYSPPAADLNPVEVLGSSRFLTFLTSSATPSTVLTVDGASSRVSNLTAQIPAGGNRGISVSGIASGVFVTQSVPPAAPNTSVGLVLRGSATGRDIGISMPLVATGEVLGVLDSSVGGAPTLVDAEVDAQVGVRTDPAATGSLVVRRTEMAAARGIDVSPGVNVSADNVQVRAGNASGLFVGVNAAGGAGGDATVDVNHLTILGNGDPSSFGLASTSVGGGNSTITVNAQNTILGGVAVSASRTAMGGMNVANLGISYSDFDPATAVGSPAQGPGNINADPQLALSGGEIFEPQATSPVINAGAPGDLASGAESPTDVDFNPRISGGRRDMGAVEFQFGFLPPPVSVLPAPDPAAQPARDDPVILEDLTVNPSAFAVAPSSTPVAARGTRISYRLNEPANVALQIQRAARGRRSGRRCVRPTRRLRRARRCTRYRRVGALRRNSTAGKTNVRFTGRIGRRALRPGKHRVVALAVDAGSNRSESANARFRVVRTPHRR